ncbi:MAG TPA: 3-dehydroquinate synthase, partial [Actinomycetota bacterium]|nr:3-dehydroquinate synthase [Actinomycetota bacterium]
EFFEAPKAETIALVSDSAVASLHGEGARAGLSSKGARVEQFTLEPGEASKSTETLDSLWRWLAGIGMHRADVVAALGGGVVGDVAGFAAATFNRGVPLVQMPTTLLGQIDSAIGGKTAIDLPEGKNLVGAFHQPRAVICDTTTLQTLPDDVFTTGMAEVIKHALISEGTLADRLGAQSNAISSRDAETLTTLVVEAAAVKVRVIEEDETEQAARAYLNYGHTLAHALEALAGYSGPTHGEAVAIGMMFAANLAAELGYADRVGIHRSLLETYGLPTTGAGFDYEDVARAWLSDKKYDAGMRFVLLEDLGRPLLVRDVAERALRKAYEAVR